MPFGNMMNPGGNCCTPPTPPSPCVFTVTVLSVTTLAPVSGITITIKTTGGTTVCTGTTNSSGVFTCSVTDYPGMTNVTATADGGCTYTGRIDCGIPVTLYYCTTTVDYQAVDDGGGGVDGVTFIGNPASPYGSIVAMTGGETPGMCDGGTLVGEWSSDTAGSIRFCWFGPAIPVNNPIDTCYPTAKIIGHISTCHPGCDVFDDTYWDTCTPPYCVTCDSTGPFNPVYYRRSEWNKADWCGCSFIPKTLVATCNGPIESLGSDNGVAITLTWESSSWDGDGCNAVDGYGNWKTMRYSAARGPNGAGGNCVYTASYLGQKWVVIGDFVAFKKAALELVITPGTTGGGTYPEYCSAFLTYYNYWTDAGTVGPSPHVCFGDTVGPVCKLYCSIPVYDIVGGTGHLLGYNYFCQYPNILTWSMQDPARDGASYPCASTSHFCHPVDLANTTLSSAGQGCLYGTGYLYQDNVFGCNFVGGCGYPYGDEYTGTTSAFVTE
jgi:hypothetical protein